MSLYEIRFKLAASKGGSIKTEQVRAPSSGEAMWIAILRLDAVGEEHWALESVKEMTS